MKAPPESIRAMLLKIQALAERGQGGEAEAAAAMLRKLCAKHSIDLYSLASPVRHAHRFSFRDRLEKQILTQCAHFVCQRPEDQPLMAYTARTYLEFDITEAEFIDLTDCYGHYRKVFRDHLDEVFEAFIAKHRLYGLSTGKSTDDKPMDPVKLQRIIDMIRSMSSARWNKPAARLTA